MATTDPLGREIREGAEDGRNRANWREPGQKPDSLLSKKPTSRLTHVQGARRNNSWYGITDAHIGPHIHKGEVPHMPSIGDVIRARREREQRSH